MRHGAAVVEIGAISRGFRRAVANALSGLSLPRRDSLDAAFCLSDRVVLLVEDGIDPVAPIQDCAKEPHQDALVTCEGAEGSEVARWARAGVTSCFVGAESLVELRAAVQSPGGDDALDVLLDASDLAIEVAGARTHLTRTQFRLLQYLSVNSGHWITPSELVKEALGTHHQNDSALVRVHIHAIRRALGPLAPLIETDAARARGYRFRSDLVQSAFATTSFGDPSSL
jgi:DNA-binding winged helix-turn-helix (wHTH) protein